MSLLCFLDSLYPFAFAAIVWETDSWQKAPEEASWWPSTSIWNNKANLASKDEKSLFQVTGMSEGSEQVFKATTLLSGMGKSAKSQDSHSFGQLYELGTAGKAAKAQKLQFVTEAVRSLIYSMTQHCKANSAEAIG